MNEEKEDSWLTLARRAYKGSTDWLDANMRRQFERNIANFQSRHPRGSKYSQEAYAKRNRQFRPKTRSVIRKNEAAAAAAFFSTVDVVSVSAEDDTQAIQNASADINREILNYRLQKTIPWFQICIGGLQDAQVNGVAIAYTGWEYEERYTRTSDAEGDIYESKVVKDKPCIRLVPVENFRFDPAADWLDPVNSSPYLIEMLPMYVCDVIERTRMVDPKTGQPKWKPVTEEQMKKSAVQDFDSTRQAREKDRRDPKSDKTMEIHDYSIVWVHRNIVRKDGRDYLYHTLGTETMLSDPSPLDDSYLRSERPYVMGYVNVETHKNYPSGTAEMTESLQSAANDLKNQRGDNIDLVLNKRYKIKRTGQVDMASLIRNVPGGGVLMNETNDVEVMDTPDVTSSSYAEQDRIDNDFDELAGNFSQSSVQSNRGLNETVGGMRLVSAGANQLTEYMLRVYTETFVEPLMRKLIKLEQAYETDAVILALAGKNAKIYQKYGIDHVTDELLNQELTVSVSVGIGSTDPIQGVERFLFALRTLAEFKPDLVAKMNDEEVVKEVFGKVGFRDGFRFFHGLGEEEDPRMAELEGMVQQLNKQLEEKHAEQMAKDETQKEIAKYREDQETRRLEMKLGAEESMKPDNGIDKEKEITRRELLLAGYNKRLEQNPNALPPTDDVEELRAQFMGIAEQLSQLISQTRQASEAQHQQVMSFLQEKEKKEQAPKSVHRDANGKPLFVEIEGYEVKAVVYDEQGNISRLQ